MQEKRVSKRSSRTAPLLRIVFCLAGLTLVVFGLESFHRHDWIETDGVVIAEGSTGRSPLYVIAYEHNGRRFTFQTTVGVVDMFGAYGRLHRGSGAPIKLDPLAPHRAVRNTLNGLYGISMCFLFLTLTAAGALVAVRKGKSRAEPAP